MFNKFTTIYLGENTVKCELCPKVYLTDGQLKKHMITHAGVKPFPCDLCDKTFADNNKLVTHRRVHTGSCFFAYFSYFLIPFPFF